MILNTIIFEENLSIRPLINDMTMSANETLISQILQQHGYDTYFIGKWDSGDHYPYTALDRGFNETLTFNLGASRYHRDWSPDIVSLNDWQSVFDTFLSILLPFSISHNNHEHMEPDCYMTDYLSKESVNLIRSRVSFAGNNNNNDNNNDDDENHDHSVDILEASADPFFLTIGNHFKSCSLYIYYSSNNILMSEALI